MEVVKPALLHLPHMSGPPKGEASNNIATTDINHKPDNILQNARTVSGNKNTLNQS
jgi:hypothetical protein